VQKFLPTFNPLIRLDVDNPRSMGPVGIPDIYTEARYSHQKLVEDAYGPIVETLGELAKHFSRQYLPIESYRMDDAQVALVTMGALGETAMEVVDARRDKGEKIGLVRIRLWRPFPFADFARAIGKVPVLGVMDRALSIGGPLGPVASEIKSALYQGDHRPKIVEFVAGLGGRDVTVQDFGKMFDTLQHTRETGQVPKPAFIGLRE